MRTVPRDGLHCFLVTSLFFFKVTTDPLGESFTRPARHVKGLVCSATGAISLAVLALTSFILLAVARFAVTQVGHGLEAHRETTWTQYNGG